MIKIFTNIMAMEFHFSSNLWIYPGEGAWHFITLPTSLSNEINSLDAWPRKGFGSIKIIAQIGTTKWMTSIFPDKKSNSFLLPVKKEIRIKNHLELDQKINVKIELINTK